MQEFPVNRRNFIKNLGVVAAAAPIGAAISAQPVQAAAAASQAGSAKLSRIRIVSAHSFTEAEVGQIRSAAPVPIELILCRNREEFLAALPEADATYGRVRGEELASAPRLKWVQNPAAGVEFLMEDEAFRNSPVILTNHARTFAPGISETAMGLLLCLTRGITKYYHPMFLQRRLERVGTPSSEHHIELAGRTMAIVGMGGIGSSLARRAHYGFDMRIVGTDAKALPRPEYVAELRDPGWFPEMASIADVLVCAAPLTPQTVKMFNEGIFRSMKPTAYFLGLSRGELFDDLALVKALKEGWIAGAGLDVFPQEPPPADHPIYDCPNAVMTPHTSGWGRERQERLVAMYAENVRRFALGLPLVNVVDKQLMY